MPLSPDSAGFSWPLLGVVWECSLKQGAQTLKRLSWRVFECCWWDEQCRLQKVSTLCEGRSWIMILMSNKWHICILSEDWNNIAEITSGGLQLCEPVGRWSQGLMCVTSVTPQTHQAAEKCDLLQAPIQCLWEAAAAATSCSKVRPKWKLRIV